MEIHKAGEGGEIKKPPEDPKKLTKILAERAKALLARIAAKLNK